MQEIEKLTIADETLLWCLWDTQCVHKEQVLSEGYIAQMFGLDRVDLRGRYHDYLKKHDVECAHLQREKEIRESLVLTREQR